MSQFLGDWKRSSYCADVTKESIGQKVTLMGWCDRRSDHGGLIFIDLRDRTGVMQVVFNESISAKDVFELASSIRNEFVLAIRGTIVERAEDNINPKLKTGYIEVRIEDFKILSKSDVVPFQIDSNSQTKVSENLRLKYRYLDLRRSEMQNNLKIRHRVAKICRDFYDENGFLEIETPTLCKSTPEGARDYLVPSRIHEGAFYALPQSPQIYKQLLMLSGFDKYFQIARCYRDEDLRADRQPEFTQIDVEMSFVDQEDVISINEKFIQRVYSEVLDIQVQLPLPRLTYAEAMNRFGSDKPDTRFGLELVNITEIAKEIDFGVFSNAISAGGSVRAINAKSSDDKLARREIDHLVEHVKQYGAKGLAWISITADGTLKSAITKFMTPEQTDAIIKALDGKPNDTLFFVADASNSVVFAALGALRLELAKKFSLIDESLNNWLWVTDFPLFEYDAKEKRFSAMHHPFTSPRDEDIDKLDSDPGSVCAKAYDIILNGNEIGGGSIRIHDSALQEKMFRTLGFTDEQAQEQFGFLINAFKYGPPPHGGLALGLDRLIMLMCKTTSIRDVIAFPKIQNASCPMTEAPSIVDTKQLDDLRIKVALTEKI